MAPHGDGTRRGQGLSEVHCRSGNTDSKEGEMVEFHLDDVVVDVVAEEGVHAANDRKYYPARWY